MTNPKLESSSAISGGRVASKTAPQQTGLKAPPGMSFRYRCVRKIGYFFRLQLRAQPGWLWRLAMRLLAWIVRLYSLTLHYLVEDSAGYFSNRLERPAIFLLWHNRVLGPAAYYRRRCRQRPACVLTSTSPEGGLVALFLGHFRLETVRVATLPRAANAMRELARRIGEQQDVIVTPDGPLGPRYYLKPGALYLAQTTGCPIVPLHVEYSRYVRLKSWDGFVLPLPLSRVKITFDKPFWVNASSEDDEFETERRRIEQTMISALVMDRNATGR